MPSRGTLPKSPERLQYKSYSRLPGRTEAVPSRLGKLPKFTPNNCRILQDFSGKFALILR
jgi:hypothetical protein